MLPALSTRLTEPSLYAALRGSARFVAEGVAFDVDAGTALWAPAGTRLEVHPDPGAVLLPVPRVRGTAGVPITTPFADTQLHGLLQDFSLALGHLDGDRNPLAEVVAHGPAPIAPPPDPRSSDLRELVDRLLSDPRLRPAEAVAGWSLRTVQRRFSTETGLTITAWLRRARIAEAARLLVDGRDLEWVAHRVGYRSVAGFIRSFAEVTGRTPGRWRSGGAGYPGPGELRLPADAGAVARRTWSRVNGAHVAVWAAVGSSTISVGGRALTLHPGEAVVLPAGVPNEVRIPADSLLLPIGYRSGQSGAVGAPVAPARLGGLETLEPVESMLAAYTTIGAPGIGVSRGFDAVLNGSQRSETDDRDAVVAALASLIAREPHLELSSAAELLGRTERELTSVVRERAGSPMPSWRRMSRMTRARNGLGRGASPSELSRELGYAHLPAFSRAFREVHGSGPSTIRVPDLLATRASFGREQTFAAPGRS